MDAISMLKQDHKKVRGLFRQFAGAGDRAFQRKQRTAEKTFEELEAHTTLEEEIFYPAISASRAEEGKDLVQEAIQEHQVAKDLISRLKGMVPEDEEYDATYTVLRENVEHHIQEEEGEMFPYAQRALSATDMKTVSAKMTARKASLLQPGFLEQAKTFVSDALDALTGNGAANTATTRTTKRSSKRAALVAPKHRTQRARSVARTAFGNAQPAATRRRRLKAAVAGKTVARKVGRKITKAARKVKKSGRRLRSSSAR